METSTNSGLLRFYLDAWELEKLRFNVLFSHRWLIVGRFRVGRRRFCGLGDTDQHPKRHWVGGEPPPIRIPGANALHLGRSGSGALKRSFREGCYLFTGFI